MNRTTRDIYLAAAWMAMGAKYEGVDKTDPRHQEFTFSSTSSPHLPENQYDSITIEYEPDLEDIQKKWVNSDLMINAVDFKNAIQRMKSIIHSS